MTTTDPRAELQQLSDRTRQVQEAQRELRQQIEAQQALVTEHQRVLDDLGRGIFAGRRRSRYLIVAGIILALIGGTLVYALYLWRVNRPDTSRLGLAQLAPLAPHLLITSEPSPAAVFIDDEARGQTPLLFRSPRSTGRFLVRVQADGYRPLTRTLAVTPRGGAHWHAVLPGGGAR